MMGRGAKWSCLLREMVQPERASREPLVAALRMTLTKAPAIVNEAAEACVLKNMSVVAQQRKRIPQSVGIENCNGPKERTQRQ
jgi:hypothetical protein